MELSPSDGGNLSYEKLLEAYARCTAKPTIIVVDAKSEPGQFILANRDGEVDFDHFHHAYVKRDEQTFLVPLWEIAY